MSTYREILDHPVKAFQKEAPEECGPLVLEELERILESRQFRHCTRGKQFLRYVVTEKLNGRIENLKERSIGVAIFRRTANYATGDDPVVRVQAGEVRRRLEQYYQEAPEKTSVRIELPVGSYSPEFHRHSLQLSPPEASSVVFSAPSETKKLTRTFNAWSVSFFSLLAAVLMLAVLLAFMSFDRHAPVAQAAAPGSTSAAGTVLNEFWAPVLGSPQPLMIYLAKEVTYRPAISVYDEYARTHHGAFSKEVQRANDPIPLNPDRKLLWSQMVLYSDYGVATGDVDSAVRVSSLMGRLGKPDQVRIGRNFSYADLSNSPSILIGAFNDCWTIKLMAPLHFSLKDEGSQLFISEAGPHGRRWFWKNVSSAQKDYAVVTRLVNSSTGQYTVILAGLSGQGTEAAGEFVTNESILAAGLKNLPRGWPSRNLQLVLETNITDSEPDAAHVVASYSW